jgi:hypothetical protein
MVVDGTRFKMILKMLRATNRANFRRKGEPDGLPPPRPGEGLVDWMVRAGVAATPQNAAAGLAKASQLEKLLEEVEDLARASQTTSFLQTEGPDGA